MSVSTPALCVVVPASEDVMLPVYCPVSGAVLPSDILPTVKGLRGPVHRFKMLRWKSAQRVDAVTRD